MADDISSFTKTYDTADYTVAEPTAVAVVTTGAALTSYGFTEAQANAIIETLNALVADVAQLRKVTVAIINEMENDGLVH